MSVLLIFNIRCTDNKIGLEYKTSNESLLEETLDSTVVSSVDEQDDVQLKEYYDSLEFNITHEPPYFEQNSSIRPITKYYRDVGYAAST